MKKEFTFIAFIFLSLMSWFALASLINSPIRQPPLYFQENSTNYSKKAATKDELKAKKVLKHIYKLLNENQGITKLDIVGHCDYLETDTLLGIQRAEKTRADLILMGIDSSRLISKGFYCERLLISKIQIESFNKSKEVKVAHALNRRVEFIVTGYEKQSSE